MVLRRAPGGRCAPSGCEPAPLRCEPAHARSDGSVHGSRARGRGLWYCAPPGHAPPTLLRGTALCCPGLGATAVCATGLGATVLGATCLRASALLADPAYPLTRSALPADELHASPDALAPYTLPTCEL
eukprot:3616942-Rhodomonas_salina.1